jgi:hypothetical protein
MEPGQYWRATEPNFSYLENAMIESALQKHLREHGLIKTEKDLFLKVRVHPEQNNLVLFCYDQIDSPKSNPVVTSARGHILDSSNNWAHVARPFDRFFNDGEGCADSLDVRDSVCYTKEDGSLISLWFYNDRWNVSTKGSPNAGGSVGDCNFTFQDLFWDVWNKLQYKLPKDTSKTYVFELCTKWNRVVVPQPLDRIILLCVRHNLSGIEDNPSLYSHLWEVAKSHNLFSLQDIKDTFANIPALYNEGHVVTQYLPCGRVKRLKVKHPGYLAISSLKEGITKRRLLELKRSGEDGEFLSMFPEYSDQFSEIDVAYENFHNNLTILWSNVKDISDQKEFALAIRGVRGSNYLFAVRKNNETLRSVLSKCSIDALMGAIGLS